MKIPQILTLIQNHPSHYSIHRDRIKVKAFFGTHDDEPLGLAVGACGSHAAGFEDRVEFCLFDLLGRIFTAGIPFLG